MYHKRNVIELVQTEHVAPYTRVRYVHFVEKSY